MPIIIPVHDAYTPEITVEIIFLDTDDLVVDSDVLLHAPVHFADTDTLVVSSKISTPVHFVDTDTIQAVGRLNAEANRFGEVHFEDSDSIELGESTNHVLGYVTLLDTDQIVADSNLEVVDSFGFTIFVDITDAATESALHPSNNIRRYSGRLVVDGSDVPIIRAQLSAPSDKLGTALTVILADQNLSAITIDSLINFDIAIWLTGGGGSWQWINLITGGKLSQRSARYVNEEGLPKDAIEISIVDIVGDRWNRAPRRQVYLYDSQKIDPPTNEAILSQTIYSDTGHVITPLFVPISGMKLRDVLHYAYITGCGFDNVITNIPNFPVEQASFTVTGGYDAGVRSYLELFSPVVFASNNDLWIIDPDQPLPAGISSVDFVAAFSASIDDTLPAHEPVNGILVRVNDALAGTEFFTERLETSTVSNGVFGTPGYTEVDTERRIREFRIFANPTAIVREEVAFEQTRTLDYTFAVTSIETRTDHIDSLLRPTGYTLSVSQLLPDVGDPDLNPLLQEVTHEEQLITYVPDPFHVQSDIQSRIETRTEGLILVDSNTQYLGEDYKIPYVDAHKSGYIQHDGMSTQFGPVRTVIEQLSFNGGQVKYETRVMNHLANVPDKITIKTLPGSSRIDRKISGHEKYVLLTVPGTDAVSRRVAEFDGSQLPYNTALALAQRKLTNLNNPPKELAVNMAYVNPSLRRGAVIHVQGRSSYLGNYILKGYTITIEAVDLKNYHASMNFEARELRS